ncbi:MAG: RidA family protein [Rhodoferax sp.]|nr:RidA family protein [Rhodoferax sp.]
MTLQKLNPSGIAAPMGAYSQGILAPAAGEWLHISGQIGVQPDGTLAAGFAAQAKVAWENLVGILEAANMDVSHLVKVTTYLVDGDHLKELNAVRSAFLGSERPASTLVVVRQLARSEWLFEVEAVAYRG